MNQPFEFSKDARHDLTVVLRQRKHDREAIGAFISGAQFDVDEWLFLWPPLSAADMEEGRRRLHNIERKIGELIYEISNLPLGWRQPLWIKLGWITDPSSDSRKDAGRVEDATSILRDLDSAINDQLDEGFFAGGRDNARKGHLVKRLAQRYEEAFGKRPSATPTGPFMDVIAIVGEALDLAIGKDAVGAILKELRSCA
jgi:hypothetical protein